MFPDRGVQAVHRPAYSRAAAKVHIPGPAWALLSFLTLLLLTVPERSPAQGVASGGAIEGTVRITEKLTAQRMRFRLYPGVKAAPPPRDDGSRDGEYRNIVIYLRSDTPPPPPARSGERVLKIAQEGEAFVPHVLPILVGSTVEFPNMDPIFHNVFSLSGTRTFDLGRYPQGDSKSVKFDRPGIVPVFCHIHSDMSAIILVLDNPWFTVPDADRGYRISDIPPGSYTLVAWHERTVPVEAQVEIKDGQTLKLNLTVPIEDEEPLRP